MLPPRNVERLMRLTAISAAWHGYVSRVHRKIEQIYFQHQIQVNNFQMFEHFPSKNFRRYKKKISDSDKINTC